MKLWLFIFFYFSFSILQMGKPPRYDNTEVFQSIFFFVFSFYVLFYFFFCFLNFL